jgi:hypothetical protein
LPRSSSSDGIEASALTPPHPEPAPHRSADDFELVVRLGEFDATLAAATGSTEVASAVGPVSMSLMPS